MRPGSPARTCSFSISDHRRARTRKLVGAVVNTNESGPRVATHHGAATAALIVLWVGMKFSPARERLRSLSTEMQRDGTSSTSLAATIVLHVVRDTLVLVAAVNFSCLAPPGVNGLLLAVKAIRYRTPTSRPLTVARFSRRFTLYPRLRISSARLSARGLFIKSMPTVLSLITKPSVSKMPRSTSLRCHSEARRYSIGMCLLRYTFIFLSSRT